MKIVAVIQARMGSTRFPAKVLKEVNGMPLIAILLERLSRSRKIDDIIVATSEDPKNDPLEKAVRELGREVFRGSENNVLERYYLAAKKMKADVVVRITGDCPLIDPALTDQVIQLFLDSGADYACNVTPPTFPDGLDTEVFTFSALERACREAQTDREKEHVTPYIREQKQFGRVSLNHETDLSAERWTVDEPEDFTVVRNILEHFAPDIHFSWERIMELKKEKPELFAANEHLIRNEGAGMSTGQKLWKRARKIIPGGNMLLSKRAEMHLPEKWPSYFSRAKGCRVWDLDGRELIDMSIMGIGTNTLGYGNPEVDAAVSDVIAKGNMSTLNCPEEVYLAERLVELHPWADMVRFARTGGEANAVAIRIARAATGKDRVAFCGYHGWHDWYLAANLGSEKNLDGHLLPGLEPAGVPRNLSRTIYPFHYNDYEELENLVSNEDIGVIFMEVSRNEGPAPGYLKKVRDLATQKGAVLIFDECTSGFRETFGGLHKKYGVEPDMAMFGKALGNGYAITAAIGRREIMEAAQSTFISSTFWTERIGPAAALKTLEVMEKTKSWEIITETGKAVTEQWRKLGEAHGLALKTAGLPALTSFYFLTERNLAYKTLITQEMLKRGYLAGTGLYVCTLHDQPTVAAYLENLGEIFSLIADCETGKLNVSELLDGPVCHSGFKRLN